MPDNMFIDIKKECYAIASVNGSAAELKMYGQVVEKRPKNFWTGKEVEGNFIVMEEFIEDLKVLENVKKITIRMNSVGGNVYAALPIYNRLKELKAHKTVIVDGVAMSAASFIMCAADTVKVNESSLIMVHKASLFIFWESYNADGLRKDADFLDTVDRTIAAAYEKKTGLGADEVMRLMSEETYMTGKEAVAKKFADGLTDEKPVTIAASADGRTLWVNGSAERLFFPLSGLPEGYLITGDPAEGGPAGPEADESNIDKPGQAGGKEQSFIMAKDFEELKKEDPQLAEKLMAEAQAAASAELEGKAGEAGKAERDRIREIDEISALFDDETVRDAKYGEKPCTAQEMSYRAALKAAKDGKAFMAALEADAEGSGAGGVGASPPPEDKKPEGDKEDAEAEGRKAGKEYAKMTGGNKDE